MLIQYFSGGDFFQAAFYNPLISDFDLHITSSSSTRIIAVNPGTAVISTFTGTGFPAIPIPPLSGTLTGLAITDNLGGPMATITGISWGLQATVTALDAAVGSNAFTLLNGLLSLQDITLDASAAFEGLSGLDFTGVTSDITVIGSGFDDSVVGGNGDDSFTIGYGGQHTLNGGLGDDLLVVKGATSAVYFILDPGGVVDDGQLSQIEGFERYEIYGSALGDVVRTGAGNDSIRGQDGRDTLDGGAGNDTLGGGARNDELSGGDGNDLLRGGAQNDLLYGGGDNDWLFGGNHNDTLFGGAGNDRLVGDLGDDLMFGGAGIDVFRFRAAEAGSGAQDWIGDFETGVDRLVFNSTMLAGTPAPGRLGNAELSVGVASGTQGQFVLVDPGGSSPSSLFWDPDGTGATDATLLVQFQNGPPIVGSDIWIV